ncbi:hypothetical protein ACJMK2_031125 [Sinanodonta woodiana]|uniref:Uncharacterized protein n=1 Tax=Sinanodonta woodiana TaxID=1069815 RepID=A0ABD3X192_SINWO
MLSVIVAAIDLGTENSGYGYSFRSDYEMDPTRVYISTWNFEHSISPKQLTCVLCNPKGEFHSFGNKAEYNYSRLKDDNEHHNWYFFRKFKNMLLNKQVIQY